MYKILADGEILCNSNAEDLAIIDPVVEMEANKAGTFTFKMLPNHPWYDKIEYHQTVIDVYIDGELIFEGIPVSDSVDFWKKKTVNCEGDLTYLNDTIQRPAKYTGKTPIQLLTAYLDVHNAQADPDKQFTVGAVSVTGSNLYRFTNFQTTMEEIGEDLIDDLGGFLRVRHEGGVRYLDYLASSPRTSTQTIRIGKNLMDLVKETSVTDLCTVLIPQGAKTGTQTVQGIDDRVDIKTVNDGKDYIISAAAANYGKIWRTVVWDDVTVPANLKTKAEAYLSSAQWEHVTIEATAFDLGIADESVQQLRVLDLIRVISEPHGLDTYFMLTKLQLNLNDPGATEITLGENQVPSLSAQTAQVEGEVVRNEANFLSQAQANARNLLETATGGNIYFVYDSDGVLTEIRIMDTNNPDTATKIWRWNINGWGYSGDGGQTYTVAATMNGAIVADAITAGTLQGIEIIGEQGEIGGWTLSATDLSGGGSFDLSSVDITLLNRMAQYLNGNITLEQAIQYGCDLNGDGAVDFLDVGLAVAKLRSQIATSGTFDSMMRNDTPFNAVSVESAGKTTFAGGVHGVFGRNGMFNYINAYNESTPSASPYFSVSPTTFHYANANGSVSITPGTGISFYDSNGNLTKTYSAT